MAKERQLAGRKDVLQEVEAWATEKSGGPPPRPADRALWILQPRFCIFQRFRACASGSSSRRGARGDRTIIATPPRRLRLDAAKISEAEALLADGLRRTDPDRNGRRKKADTREDERAVREGLRLPSRYPA